MIVILHAVIATISLGFTTYLYLRPSTSKLHIAYGLALATLSSGVYLAWSAPVHMVHACMAGVVYLGLVTLGIVAARTKLTARAMSGVITKT
jgi:predicted amidohydrolase